MPITIKKKPIDVVAKAADVPTEGPPQASATAPLATDALSNDETAVNDNGKHGGPLDSETGEPAPPVLRRGWGARFTRRGRSRAAGFGAPVTRRSRTDRRFRCSGLHRPLWGKAALRSRHRPLVRLDRRVLDEGRDEGHVRSGAQLLSRLPRRPPCHVIE